VVNFARPFIFTTAVPPTQLAAIDAALDVIQDEPERRERVRALAQRFRAALVDKGWPAESLGDDPTPIIPLIVGEADAAVALSHQLEAAGFYAPAIRPPSVPKGTSRVRVSVHANLTDEQLDQLIKAIPEGG
jgi:8-amino-7-oxononanoate synthase